MFVFTSSDSETARPVKHYLHILAYVLHDTRAVRYQHFWESSPIPIPGSGIDGIRFQESIHPLFTILFRLLLLLFLLRNLILP